MDIFDCAATTAPGLEHFLSEEARALGFKVSSIEPGLVGLRAGWHDIWRANLELRGAVHVLVRMGSFRAMHLSQLDKRARAFPWGDWLRADVPVRVEAVCRKSKIYHSGAAKERVARAISEALGAPVKDDAALRVMVRIVDNLVTLSIDTSGEPLHKRGFKEAVGKAPMRETMAALFLRAAGFNGAEPVFDPMCGSGTFPLEAAEMALSRQAGRARGFAFEMLPSFNTESFEALRKPVESQSDYIFAGSDRNAGAIAASEANAKRADLSGVTKFTHAAISDAEPPCAAKGLVMINPPYGARIGDKSALLALHKKAGEVLKERFSGWRVGIVTSDAGLARATELPFRKPGPLVDHGGLKIRLFKTDPLP